MKQGKARPGQEWAQPCLKMQGDWEGFKIGEWPPSAALAPVGLGLLMLWELTTPPPADTSGTVQSRAPSADRPSPGWQLRSGQRYTKKRVDSRGSCGSPPLAGGVTEEDTKASYISDAP